MNKLSVRWLLMAGGGILAITLFVLTTKSTITANHASLKTSSPLAATNRDIDLGSSAGDKPAPDFKLLDQQGRLTTLTQFRGKVVVIGFVDPRCTDLCPLMTESMVEALHLLGPAAAQVQLLGISANPDATNVADVADYTRAHRMQGRWRFLTGSTTQLKRVWDSYHVYAATVDGDAEHDPIIILIGPQGRERRMYFTQMSYEGIAQQAQLMANDIASLLPGRPAVTREVSLQFIPPISPAKSAQLAAFGPDGNTIHFGTGHPHLVLFFADWLAEATNLPTKLAVLDRYAKMTQAQGQPSPVAVDERSTETSARASKQMLAQLVERLQTPIVEDTKGRLADGYNVQELPWFALTSDSGQILWHHAGWLSTDELGRQVRAALKRK